MDRVTPSGKSHDVGSGIVPVAVLDPRGVFTVVNSAFCDATRYSAQQLLGANVSLLRHPEMPTALMSLVAGMVEVGAPSMLYMLNLAADGSAMWSMSVLAPFSGGVLVASTSVADTARRDTLYTTYREVRRGELRARLSGVSPAERADAAHEQLLEGLHSASTPDYVSYIVSALPAELTRRRDGAGALPVASGRLSQATRAVREQTTAARLMIDELASGTPSSGPLGEVAAAKAEFEAALAEALTATEAVAKKAPVLLSTLRAVRTQSATAVGHLGSLGAAEDEDTAPLVAELRFAAATLDLFVEALDLQALALEEPAPPAHDVHSFEQLQAACAEQVDTLSTAWGWYTETRGGRLDATTAARALADTQLLLAKWVLLVPKSGMSDELGPCSRRLEQALTRLCNTVGELTKDDAPTTAEDPDLAALRTHILALPSGAVG